MALVIVVEGDTDVPIASKLARDAKLEVARIIDAAGKDRIDERFSEYNRAACGSPWLVLRDLNSDAECAPTFIKDRRLTPTKWMCLRLAVREIESWLMADAPGLAKFLGIEEQWIPTEPDREPDPTITLVDLARRSKGHIRRAMVPEAGAPEVVGPLYEATIIEFGQQHWSISRAVNHSVSLRRARAAVRKLSAEWKQHIGGG